MANFILELKMTHSEEMPKLHSLVITTAQQLFSTKLLKQETRLSLWSEMLIYMDEDLLSV